MGEQEATPERRKPSVLSMKRARRRQRLKRKRRALEAIHESCVARTARRMLRDCELAIGRLPSEDASQALWRHGWFGVVTLLRAIGHGLKNEDGARSDYLREAVEEAWQRWKSDLYSLQLFYGFIEEERNVLLKEYRFVNERKIYPLEQFEGVTRDVQHLVVIVDRAVPPDDALHMACQWWRAEIARVERHAANLRELHISHEKSSSI